jgi:Icc-related predicted phosphoesterase
MRIVLISDIHNREVELPEGDLLVLGGDLTKTGTPSQIAQVNSYIEKHRHKYNHKPIAVAGNHDFLFQNDRPLAEAELESCIYIEDSEITIGGVRIWGSPWTPRFGNWAFMKERGDDIRRFWEKIPEGLDLLVTHGPPWGILDDCGQHVGCEELLKVVSDELAQPPRFHAFGHIHEGHGVHVTPKTTYYNISICDEYYAAVNPVTVVEI